MRKAWLGWLILICIAAGCSSPDGAEEFREGHEHSEGVEAPGEADADNGEQSDPTPRDSEPLPEPPNPSSEEAEWPKLYTMNGAYRIVPLDPDGGKKVVLLTFDDGPRDEKLVNEMLEVLDKHGAKAIFFVIGTLAERNPELLLQIKEHGHAIGNHTWGHLNLKDIGSKEEIDAQIDRLQDLVTELTGEAPVFFRPPYGASTPYVREKAEQEHMLFMTWSNGSEDWVAKYQTPEGVTSRVLEQLHHGANILMHEYAWTVEALDGLLSQIKERGYSFVDPRTIETPAGEP